MIHLLALLIGVVAGSRTFTAPAAVAWAAHFGWLQLQESPFAFLGGGVAPWVLIVLAAMELVTDKLPMTPSRKIPAAFGARVLSGGFAGAALGASSSMLAVGPGLGIVGAIIGTLGGYALRVRLAAFFRHDLPAALIEDALAVGGALVIVLAAA
jgi:uncharacterized membrane protein